MKELEIKALELLNLGRTETEVAKACGKSRSWVQRLKRKHEAEKLKLIPNLLQLVPNKSTTNSVGTNSIDTEDVQTTNEEIQPTILTKHITQSAVSNYKTDIEQLYENAMSQLQRILNNPESRDRDILTATKLVMDARQNSFIWSLEIRDLHKLSDRELIKVALRNIIANARSQSDVVMGMRGLIESDKIPTPHVRDLKTTDEFDKQNWIDIYKRDYGIDLNDEKEFRKYIKFYFPNEQDKYFDKMTRKVYVDE